MPDHDDIPLPVLTPWDVEAMGINPNPDLYYYDHFDRCWIPKPAEWRIKGNDDVRS